MAKNIKFKIVLVVLISTALFSALVGISSSVNSNRTAVEQANQIMLSEAQKSAFALSQILSAVEIKATNLGDFVSLNYDFSKKDNIKYLHSYDQLLGPYVKKICEETEYAHGAYMTFGPPGAIEPFEVYYADQEGNHVYVKQPSVTEEDYLRTDDPDMDWYFDPIKYGKGVWIRPYIDPTINVKMISYALPVYVDGNVVGVSGIDIHLSKLQQIVKEIKVYETGSAFLLNSKLEFIVHNIYTEDDRLDTVEKGIYSELINTIKNQQEGVVHLTVGGIHKAFSFSWLPSGHILIIEVPDSEIFESVEKMNMLNIFIITSGILLALIFAIYISRKLGCQIDEMTENIVRIAEGDFSTQIGEDFQNRNDEIGVLSKAVMNMQASIRTMLDERNTHIEELREKSIEISRKNLEITALYNQTAAMNDELHAILQKVEDGYLDTVKTLSNTIEANDKYTKGHTQKVAEYSLVVAEQMGMDENSIKQLEYAALLHDIGKIGISDRIINKPGKLSEEEYETVKKHPEIACKILSDIEFLSTSVTIISQHHERPDGKGYPNGLKNSEICLQAKIIAVADSFDAMVRARPYRQNPLSIEEAIEILKENRDKQFDKDVVESFIKAINENIMEIKTD